MLRLPLALLALAACTGGTGTIQDPPDGDASVRLEEVASGLAAPVHLTAPAGDPRLFVVEQPGRIRVVEDGRLLPTPFLDLTDRVRSGGERGLLSVAFHPDYARNGRLFVYYTDLDGDTRVERYTVTDDPDRADPASAKPILSVEQPYANHNGGLVVFGPDGKLYVGLGDGGSGGDPQGNGQDLGTLLGKILRIDVDAGDPYAVPPDNPFVGRAGARPEIWAYGLRNPWRFAFDRSAGLLYIADVGQNEWEEIDVAPADRGGLNYGWNTMEGSHCFGSSSCAREGLTAPVVEYPHSEGCSVTGGHVYRGRRAPSLAGRYVYGDYCQGWVRTLRRSASGDPERQTLALGDVGSILSFGEDSAGELYLLSSNGRVYRMVE
jgi:glucose/arabinose dehydrogenase